MELSLYENDYYVHRFTNAKSPFIDANLLHRIVITIIIIITITCLLTRIITEGVCTLYLNNECSYSLLQTCAETTGP